MPLVFTKGENQESKITITIFEKEYKETVDKKIKEYTQKATIKGYRPGKVPITLINQLYGEDIINQELKTISEKQLDDFFKTTELCLIGSLVNTNIKKENNDFTIEYSIDAMNAFNTEIPNNLTFINYIVEDVPDYIIDDQIISLQISQGKCLDSETINKNSIFFTSISYTDYFCPQALLFFPKFSEEMKKPFIGKKRGDVINFDLKDLLEHHTNKIFFENNDAPLINEIPSKVDMAIIDIKDIEMSNIDREKLAKTLGVKNIESDEEVRDLIKKDMLSKIIFFKDNLLQFELVNKIIEQIDFELPQYIVKKYIMDSLKTEEDKQNTKLIDTKIKSLKWNLICSEIIHKKKLTPPNEAIENMMQHYANEVVQHYASQMQEKLSLPQIKKIIEENNAYIRSKATKHAKEEFVINFLKNQVILTDEKILYTDLEKILKKYSKS